MVYMNPRQKMAMSKYLCLLSNGIDHSGLRGMEKIMASVKTLKLDMAVPVISVRLQCASVGHSSVV